MTNLVQKIRPHTKRNGSLFILIGSGAFLLTHFIHLQVTIPWSLRLCISAFSLIAVVLGVGKLAEPATSLEISPQYIRYLHFRGSWELQWSDLVRYDIPVITRGLKQHQTPFLGLKLRSYDAFLTQLSPRLAVHLIHQQRTLMMQAIRSEMPAHRSYTDYIEVADFYRSESGQQYHGLLATFATRMTLMREMLGYDLYIPQNAFDRPLDEFIVYLKALQMTRMQHLDSES